MHSWTHMHSWNQELVWKLHSWAILLKEFQSPKQPSGTGEKIEVCLLIKLMASLWLLTSLARYSRLSSDRRGVGPDQLRARFDIPDAAAVTGQKTGKGEINIYRKEVFVSWTAQPKRADEPFPPFAEAGNRSFEFKFTVLESFIQSIANNAFFRDFGLTHERHFRRLLTKEKWPIDRKNFPSQTTNGRIQKL